MWICTWCHTFNLPSHNLIIASSHHNLIIFLLAYISVTQNLVISCKWTNLFFFIIKEHIEIVVYPPPKKTKQNPSFNFLSSWVVVSSAGCSILTMIKTVQSLHIFFLYMRRIKIIQNCLYFVWEERGSRKSAQAHNSSAVCVYCIRLSLCSTFSADALSSRKRTHYSASSSFVLVLVLRGNLIFLVCCCNTVWKSVMVWIIIFQTNLIHWFPWDENQALFHSRCI